MLHAIKFPTPPRPKFPSSSIPTIKEASQLIDFYASSLFDPARHLKPPTYGAEHNLEQFRSSFEELDKAIRSSFLITETLRQSFERAKEAHGHIKKTRKDLWVLFQKLEGGHQTPRWSEFPMEVVYAICALDCQRRGTSSSIARWGDIYFQANDVRIKSSNIATRKEWIAKSRRLILEVEIVGAVVHPAPVEEGRWRELSVVVTQGQFVQPWGVYQVLRLLDSGLHNVEALQIQDPKGTKRVWECLVDGTEAEHRCNACDMSTDRYFPMPRCQVVQSPLGVIPYIGPFFSNIVHLSITVWARTNLFDFGSHFHHISLRSLESLRIVGTGVGDPSIEDDDGDPLGSMLDTPSLKSLIIAAGPFTESTATSFLTRLNCPGLTTLVFYKTFEPPSDEGVDLNWVNSDVDGEDEEDEDSEDGIGEFNERNESGEDNSDDEEDRGGQSDGEAAQVPFSGDILDFKVLVTAISERCRYLKRLSFYTNYSRPGSYHPIDSIHKFLMGTYAALSTEEELARLPNLEHLSLPYDAHESGRDSLIRFLQKRSKACHPIRMLEINFSPFDRCLQMEQIELYVDHLCVSHEDLFDFYCGSCFPVVL